jgi:hypothetical protein
MDEDKRCELRYINCGNLKSLLVRRAGSPDFKELHPGIVQLGSSSCSFEREGGPEFQVKDSLELHFHLEDRCVTAPATVVSVDGWKCLDEGYHHQTWYRYGVELDCELDANVCERLITTPKRSMKLLRGTGKLRSGKRSGSPAKTSPPKRRRSDACPSVPLDGAA